MLIRNIPPDSVIRITCHGCSAQREVAPVSIAEERQTVTDYVLSTMCMACGRKFDFLVGEVVRMESVKKSQNL